MFTGYLNNRLQNSFQLENVTVSLLPPTGASGPHCLFILLTKAYSVFLSVFRAPIWRGRSVRLPMRSAPQSIQRTASAMFSTWQRWRLYPGSTGLSSNVLAHAAASNGSPSSRLELRSTSIRLPLEKTGPKAACSCRSGVYQWPDPCVDGHETILHMNLIYWWILVRSLHCIKDIVMKKKNECYPVEFFMELLVHL